MSSRQHVWAPSAPATAICPMCSSTRWFRAFTVGDLNQRTTTEEFTYLRCAACGTIFIAPVPGDLERYYGAEYVPYTWRDPERFEKMVDAEESKLAVVSQFARSGALLEVGAAAGTFAVLALRAGFDVTAVEMDADSCAFMESKGVTAICSADVAGVARSLPEFDVIALWHVLEHLPNPGEAIRALAAKLRPGGTLVVATPDPTSPEFALFGRRWVHVDAPRHLSLIPRAALDRVAHSVGLVTAPLKRRPRVDLQFDGPGWFMRSVRHAAQAWPSAVWPLRAVTTLASVPLYAPVALLQRWRGNAYTAAYSRHPPRGGHATVDRGAAI